MNTTTTAACEAILSVLEALIPQLKRYQQGQSIARIWRFIPGEAIEVLGLEYPDWDKSPVKRMVADLEACYVQVLNAQAKLEAEQAKPLASPILTRYACDNRNVWGAKAIVSETFRRIPMEDFPTFAQATQAALEALPPMPPNAVRPDRYSVEFDGATYGSFLLRDARAKAVIWEAIYGKPTRIVTRDAKGRKVIIGKSQALQSA